MASSQWKPLRQTRPGLAALLVDPADADRFSANVDVKLRWFCVGTPQRPHPRYEYEAQPGSKIKNPGCKVCCGRAAIPGFNSIRDTHPEWLESLVDPEDADRFCAGTTMRLRFRCAGTAEHPHPEFEYLQKGYARAGGSGCRKCAIVKQAITRRTPGPTVSPSSRSKRRLSIRETNPEWLEFLVNPEDADRHVAGTHTKLAFRCAGTVEHPHPEFEYTQMGANRVRGRGCPKCGNRLAQIRHDVIRETHPEWPPVMEVPRKADVLPAGTGDRVKFWCEGTPEKPHERCQYEQYGYNRRKGSGCPVCAGKTVASYPSLREVHPDLVAFLADPVDADAQVVGKKLSFLWRCDGGIEAPHAPVEFRAPLFRFLDGPVRCSPCRTRQRREERARGQRQQQEERGLARQQRRAAQVQQREERVQFRQQRQAERGPANQRPLASTLRELRPDLIPLLVDPADADRPASKSRFLQWKCTGTSENPHPTVEFSRRVGAVFDGAVTCLVCVHGKALPGFNTIRVLRPDLAPFLVNPADADAYVPGTARSLLWWCEGTPEVPHPRMEHMIQVRGRAMNEHPCPHCLMLSKRVEAAE